MNDSRMTAVVARDAQFDGRFVYAVVTTGVYCRPSCAARAPRPENVRFFDAPAAAEAAGYRACLRCHPDGDSRAERQAAAVTDLCRFIEDSEELPSLAALAERAGWSPSHTHRTFKAVTGVTPKAYARALRQERLRNGLAAGDDVTRATFEAGYSGSGRLYAESDGALGMTPSAYRAGGPAVDIQVAWAESDLGPVLVATTERGICAILFGDDRAATEADLRRRFTHATITPASEERSALVDAVVRMVASPTAPHDLPLDIRGRAFQRQVWEALRAIPAGQTRSYGELARALGRPTAARAVAGACAANPLAVAVPCHRVVRADGSLSGYRWGLERKRALLDREAGDK